MSGWVIDASVTLAWFFEDESSAFTDAVLTRLETDEAWVPALWELECANVLLTAQRLGRLTLEKKRELVETAMALPLLIDRERVSIGEIDGLAGRYGLTAYDAAYLELAIRRALPLVTLDAKLVAAAEAAGHPVETAPLSQKGGRAR